MSFLIDAPEANVSAVFNEKPDGKVEIGFRSKPGYDVSALAFSLGGRRPSAGVGLHASPARWLTPRRGCCRCCSRLPPGK